MSHEASGCLTTLGSRNPDQLLLLGSHVLPALCHSEGKPTIDHRTEISLPQSAGQEGVDLLRVQKLQLEVLIQSPGGQEPCDAQTATASRKHLASSPRAVQTALSAGDHSTGTVDLPERRAKQSQRSPAKPCAYLLEIENLILKLSKGKVS